MNYCTQQDLIDRYGEDELIQLTDRNGTDAIDTDVLNRAISDADGEIDSRIGSRFKAPITPIPKSLVRVGCEITRYYLYDDQVTETIQQRYKDAIKFLTGIASGVISIGVDESGAQPESENTATIESGGNVFNRKDKSFI